MNKVDQQIDDSLLGEIVDDVLSKMARGEPVDVEQFACEHPGVADVLRHALPALQAVADSDAKQRYSECTASSEQADEQLGRDQTLGDFRIVRELGRGGMGVVYEAEQISMGRRVALKVLPFAGMVRGNALQRFHNEVRAAAALDHQHIVSVYSIGEERGVHYYAMQLIRGQPLSNVIADLVRFRSANQSANFSEVVKSLASRTSPLDSSPNVLDQTEAFATQYPSQSQTTQSTEETCVEKADTLVSAQDLSEYFRCVAGLGVQAATALEHAHERGVLHRDIKPGNLMLDAASTLFVTDFGLARIETDTAMTMTGDLIGTLRYMSPEQALAKRITIDGRSDIYSLGATLYEMLALKPLFSASDRQQLLRQIAFEEPTKLRSLDRTIPNELETIVHKAIEKNPDDRYESAAALAEDLQAFLEFRPIKAKPPSLADQASKWSKRHRPLVWTLAVASTVVLVVGFSALLISYVLIAHQRTLALEQRAEAKLQAATANSVLAYITNDLLAAASPLEEPDRNIRLRAVVDRAAQRIAGQLQDEPLVAAAIQRTLGETYRSLGDYELAEQQFRGALETYQTHLGMDHHSTQECKRKLAILLLDRGQDVIAEQMLREIFEKRLQELGDQHPDTLQCMSDFARLSLYCGRIGTALRFSMHVAELRAKQLGPVHRLTLEAQQQLATALAHAGKHQRAEEYFRQVLKQRRTLLGANHPHTLETLYGLAMLLIEAESYSTAQSEMQNLQSMSEEILGSDHPFTLRCSANLAYIFSQLGQFDASEAVASAALTMAGPKLGSEHQVTFEIELVLAINQAASGETEKSVESLEAILSRLLTVFGEAHPLSLTTATELSDGYAALGMQDKPLPIQIPTEKVFTDVILYSWKLPSSHRIQQRLNEAKLAEERAARQEAEVEGVLNDWSATILNGTRVVQGRFGPALAFDGYDDRANINDHPDLALAGSLTISCWLRIDSFPAQQAGHGTIVMRSDDRGGLDPYFLRTTPAGKIEFGISSSDQALNISTEAPLDEDIHVAATLDDETGHMTLYLNGRNVSGCTTHVRPLKDLQPDRNPGIGVGNHFGTLGHNFPFHGQIEQLVISDSALTAQAIQRVATHEITAKEILSSAR